MELQEVRPGRWWAAAACHPDRYSDPDDVFFPGKSRKKLERALRVCALCPVIRQCAEAGKDEEVGVWGGRLVG